MTTPTGIDRIEALEAIRALKARYFRLLDTKQWDAWGACFTDDFEAEVHGPHPVMRFASREEMVDTNRRVLAEAPTVHHGHTDELELESADAARGVWAMMDIVTLGEGFTGYGHYHEQYRREDGVWRIARLRLTRTLIVPGVVPAPPG